MNSEREKAGKGERENREIREFVRPEALVTLRFAWDDGFGGESGVALIGVALLALYSIFQYFTYRYRVLDNESP